MPLSESAPDTEEIEITPEMIEAGVHELLGFDPEGDDFLLTVRSIFKAMLKVAPQSLFRA